MKGVSLILFLLLGIGLPAVAQEKTKSFHLGVTVTPQINTPFFTSNKDVAYHSSSCIAFSGNMYIAVSRKIQMLTGVESQYSHYDYRQYGLQFPADVKDGQFVPHRSYFNYNYTYWFLGIPAMMKWNLSDAEKKNHFFVIAGAALRYRISSAGYYQLVESGYPGDKKKLEDFFFAPSRTWIFTTLGVGYEVKTGNHKIGLSPVLEYSTSHLYNQQGSSIIVNAHPAFLGFRLAWY